MPSPKISTFCEITPLIYSWTTPDVPKYEGWEKIGYTEQESVDVRTGPWGRLLHPTRPGQSQKQRRKSPQRPRLPSHCDPGHRGLTHLTFVLVSSEWRFFPPQFGGFDVLRLTLRRPGP
jgi:hypothetical protein